MAAITWTLTPTLAKIKMPSGNVYYIKDTEVRSWIGDGTTSGAEKRITDLETAIEELTNVVHWIGITSTQLTDGQDTSPITIAGESVTPAHGDLVQDPTGTEFVYYINGSTHAWQAMGGNTSVFGAMAYANTASGTVSFGSHTKDYVLGEATTFSASGGSSVYSNPDTGSISSLSASMDTTDTEQLNLTSSSNTVLTGLGTPTHTQPTITVGTNDKVNAITALGTGSVTVSPDPTT